ncbi:MAG TPA: hypothetical protein VMT30_02565 [Candidatus Saccharimonadia bacterium]|nr:hypothetical protein [Candidatus Saccharimonadia bacterium]
MTEIIDDELRALAEQYLDTANSSVEARKEFIEMLAWFAMASSLVIILAEDGVLLPPETRETARKVAKRLARGFPA